VRNTEIYNNIVYVPETTMGIVIGGCCPGPFVWDIPSNIQAYNTVAYNNVVIGLGNGSGNGIGMWSAKDSSIYNNVVINAKLYLDNGGSGAFPVNPTFKNNIVSCNGHALYGGSNGGWSYTGTMTFDYNNIHNCTGSVPSQAHAITGDPNFVNWASDWHLQAGSPAIGAGTPVTMTGYNGEAISVSMDRAGLVRAVPWDLGIYNAQGSLPPPPTPDTSAPSVPSGLTSSAVSAAQINLSWTASTDNVGVEVYQGGVQVGTASGTTYARTGLTASTTYSFTVAAYDASGNVSAQSAQATGTTLSSSSPPPTSSLLPDSYFKFDETVAATAADSAGQNAVPLLNGASFVGGVLGNALSLDGIDDQALRDTTTGLNLSGPVTIVAFLKPTALAPNAYHTVAVKGDPAAGRGLGLNIYNGFLNFVKVGVADVRSSVALTPGVFQHVAVTWDPSTAEVKFYKDGQLAQSVINPASQGAPLDADDLTIGAWFGRGSYYNGLIDDLRIYTRALSAQEVLGLSQVVSVPPVPPVVTPADIQAPSVPASLAASATSTTQINLAWTASSDNVGVVGYRVYRNGSQVATTTSPSYSNTGLTAGTIYSFTVVAYDAAGNVSTPSAAASATTQTPPDTAAPSVPGGVTASVVSTTQINLSWAASSDNTAVTGYRVSRNGTQVGTATTTSYTNTGLTAGTSYSFTVAAYDAAGNLSGPSSAASATTQTPPDTAAPSVPGSLTATAASQTQINLAWAPATDNVGVVGYKVYRSGAQIATATTAAYSETGLTAGTTYSYAVAAYDAAGNTSGSSTAASVTTQSPPAPPAPAPSPTTARTIELSPSNADTTCNEEFENTAATLRAGDTLILHGGTYSQTCARVLSNLHGTAQQPILIRAATGEVPVLTRPTRPNGDYDQNNLEIADSSYVTLQGLVFRGGDIGVRLRGTNHHLTIENSEIADTGNAGFTANSGDTDSLTLRHNQIHHTGLFTLGATEGEGLYLGCNAATCRVTNSVIEQNYIHDLRGTSSGGNDGIEVKVGSGGNVIRHNVIHTTTIGTAYPCILVYGGGANPNTMEGNVVWQCGEALVALADAVVRNNIVLQSNTGLASYPHEQVAGLQNVTFVNNTVYGHAECASLRWAGAVNVVLANNALYCGVNVGIYGTGLTGAGVTVRANYVEGTLVGGSLDGTRFLAGGTAAGTFTNPAALDFWPQAGSLLRNTAEAAYLPSADFNGLPRTPSRDVGAYATKGFAQNVGWRITPGFKVLSADSTAPRRPLGLRVR
jgi:chitodextrinase